MKYAAYLSTAMQDRLSLLEKQASVISLHDELMVMQDLAGQAIAGYEKTKAKTEDLPVLERARARMHALDFMVQIMNQVRDMAMAAARIDNMGRGVPVGVVHALVSQVCEIVSTEVGDADGGLRMIGQDSAGVVERIAERMKAELLTVDAIASGTTITASNIDAEVKAMIESVPHVA